MEMNAAQTSLLDSDERGTKEAVLCTLTRHMTEQGAQSEYRALQNLAAKLEHRTLTVVEPVRAAASSYTALSRTYCRPKKRQRQCVRDWLQQTTWQQAERLNQAWQEYFTKLCGGQSQNKVKVRALLASRLADADLHGASICVAAPKTSSSLLDLSGIIIGESLCSWTLCTPSKGVVVVPKAGSKFRVHFRGAAVLIRGEPS